MSPNTKSPRRRGAVPLGEERIGRADVRPRADRRAGRRAPAGERRDDPPCGRSRRKTRGCDSGRGAGGFVPRNGRRGRRRGRAASHIVDRRLLRIVQTRKSSAQRSCAAPTRANTARSSPTTLRWSRPSDRRSAWRRASAKTSNSRPRGFRHRRSVDRRTRRGRKRRRDYRCRARINTASITARSTGR